MIRLYCEKDHYICKRITVKCGFMVIAHAFTLTLNLTSADYSALMTSWTKNASNMKRIALKAAFSLVLMFEVVFESSEIF